jgi:hypothetical protein
VGLFKLKGWKTTTLLLAWMRPSLRPRWSGSRKRTQTHWSAFSFTLPAPCAALDPDRSKGPRRPRYPPATEMDLRKADFLGANCPMARPPTPIRKRNYDLQLVPFDNRSAAWHLSTGSMIIPEQLSANCRNHGERQAWLDSLPAMLEELTRRWSLRAGPPFEHANVTCSWVAPVACADGRSAVLKLGMPHMEGAHEIQGLRFWNGNPTVRLLKADMALARCYLSAANPDTRFIPNRSTIKMR